MATFGTTDIPSDQITVTSGGTVDASAAISFTLGLVGGMDTGNGSATDDGTVVEVASSSDAAAKFGENSELKELVDLALAQESPPSEILAAPVEETTVTGESAGGQSGTLDNVPVFDPNVQDEHDIVASDSGGTDPTVNIVYDSPPATPTDADTVNVNPVTGEFDFDSTATGSYTFDYDYGDYSTAITNMADRVPRVLFVATENTSVVSSLETEVNDHKSEFEFITGMAGILPETTASSYSDSFDNRFISLVASSRAFTDEAETNMVRTGGAVAGKQAGKALGDSTTYESLGGLSSLLTDYTNSQLGTLIDAQVLPVKHGDRIFVVKDMTTSTDAKFERIYGSEIVNEAIEISHTISQEFIGELNTESNRFALGESHISSYDEMKSDDLLDDATVNVSEGATADEVDVSIGLDVVDVMDLIDVDITVGDVLTFEGAA